MYKKRKETERKFVNKILNAYFMFILVELLLALVLFIRN